MLITLQGSMVISCLANIVQWRGVGTYKSSEKKVKCTNRFATDCRLATNQVGDTNEFTYEPHYVPIYNTSVMMLCHHNVTLTPYITHVS